MWSPRTSRAEAPTQRDDAATVAVEIREQLSVEDKDRASRALLQLERSAPTTLRVGDDLNRVMDHATYAARSQVAAEQACTRTPRLVAGVGLAVLLTGAGAAVAAGRFEWLPWALDPDAAYVVTLPSGRDCELRVVGVSRPGRLARSFIARSASLAARRLRFVLGAERSPAPRLSLAC
jgi:hypothetical protein